MDTLVLTLTPWGSDILFAKREASMYIFLDNHPNTALGQKKFSAGHATLLPTGSVSIYPPLHILTQQKEV